MPLCFFLVLCLQIPLSLQRRCQNTNTVNSPVQGKTGILGLRGRNPQPSSFKRQYLQQNTLKQDTKLLKWKIQSEGFPDCCFSVKISYNCWVPFQFHGTSGISPFLQQKLFEIFFLNYFFCVAKKKNSGLQQAKLENSLLEVCLCSWNCNRFKNVPTQKCVYYWKKVKWKNMCITHQ